jgi:hypothetical protein
VRTCPRAAFPPWCRTSGCAHACVQLRLMATLCIDRTVAIAFLILLLFALLVVMALVPDALHFTPTHVNCAQHAARVATHAVLTKHCPCLAIIQRNVSTSLRLHCDGIANAVIHQPRSRRRDHPVTCRGRRGFARQRNSLSLSCSVFLNALVWRRFPPKLLAALWSDFRLCSRR